MAFDNRFQTPPRSLQSSSVLSSFRRSASALDSASEASDLTDSSASAREKARKKVSRRRRGQPDRWPRLLVLSVEAGTVVECQLESSKGKTVTFKFDIHDMFPRDIANNLVRVEPPPSFPLILLMLSSVGTITVPVLGLAVWLTIWLSAVWLATMWQHHG